MCYHHGFPIRHAHTLTSMDYFNLVVAWSDGREEMVRTTRVGDCQFYRWGY